MPVESATYIDKLEKDYPLQDDDVSQGDDHLRLTKSVLKNTFPGSGGDGFKEAITASETELNYVKGVTSGIQDQFSGLSSVYVGKEGSQEIKGTLTVHEELRVIADLASADFDGLTIYDAAGNLLGAFWYDEISGAVGVGNRRPNESSPETMAMFEAGLVDVTSVTIAGTPVPTLDTHLANKKYVDDNGGYPSEPFYQNGYSYDHTETRLRVDNELMINGTVDNQSDYVGISLYTPNAFNFNNPGMHGSFSFHIPTGDVAITQGAAANSINTRATFSGGNITVTSDSGADTKPTEPNHLCNKKYVDGVILAATGQAVGASGTFEDSNGKTITVVNGLITDLG